MPDSGSRNMIAYSECFLPEQLQAELELSGRAYSRDLSEIGIGHIAVGIEKLRVIERVERIGPKLQIYRLAQGNEFPNANVLCKKVDTSDEYRIVLPDGTVKYIYTIRHPVLDEKGNVHRLVGASADITELKRTQEAQRRTATYLADAHRLTRTGGWATDNAMEPLYWSEEVFRVFGCDPQNGLPTADELLQRVHPEDRDKLTHIFDSAIHGKSEDEIEFRTVLADGTVKHLHALGRPVLNDSGEVVEVVGTVVDITERKRAEESLRENEIRFRTFVDHAADALFILDLDQGTIVDVNQGACDSVGYTRQELIGVAPDFLHQDSYRAEMESVAERAVLGETVFDTHWHRRKDGTTFPVEVSTSCFWHGGRRFLLKLARDISDRLRAEKAIRKTEKQLRDVIDTIPALVWSTLPDGSVDFINRRTVEFTGLSFEQASGEGWQSVIHPEDRDDYLAVERAAVASAQAFEIEARIRRADGEYRWMLFRSVPFRDETGTVLKRYGVSTDIDDRNRAQQALKRSEAYLADAQRLAHTGSWAWDPATRQALYWSEEMFRIFGLNPQQGLPEAEVFWQRIHPDDFDRTYEVLMKAAAGNADYEHEHRIVLPDGTVKHIHAIGHPALDQTGQAIEYVGTAVDITERKRAEEALRRVEGYLVEAQRLTHTGAWATDAGPQPLYWSQELFRLYGLDPQQGFPTHDEALQCVHPEDWDRYVQTFHRVIHQKMDSDVEF
jgi:PAS domain S-box-containing protein